MAITERSEPRYDYDVVNYRFFKQELSLKLDKTGGVISGNLTVDNRPEDETCLKVLTEDKNRNASVFY